MRLSVECTFPHLGKRGAASRKSAVCMWNITEKRSLWLRRHQKAHSGARRLGRVHFSVRSNSNRDLRTLAQPAPQAGGWLLERICPVELLSIVPRSLAGGCPTPPGRRSVTEKRILRRRPHGKAHSEPAASRKSTFCVDDLTEKHILALATHGKVHSVWATRWKGHSVRWPSRKSAFRVRAATQSAPFREGLQPECTFP